MIRRGVRSSTVKSVGYDLTSRTLEVEFNDGGVYRYHDVSPQKHLDLLRSKSIGSFLHAEVKGKHQHTKVG